LLPYGIRRHRMVFGANSLALEELHVVHAPDLIIWHEDGSLTLSSLEDLGDRLNLPSGWSYRSHILTQDEDMGTQNGEAYIVQDELKNTYQLFLP
jgi:hypothetical protein